MEQECSSRIKRLNFGIPDAIITVCDNAGKCSQNYRKQTDVRKCLQPSFSCAIVKDRARDRKKRLFCMERHLKKQRKKGKFMYQGAIFDLDGTILDSMWVWEEIDREFLGKRNLRVPDDYMEAIAPLGFERAAEYTIRRFQLQETSEEIIREWYEMAADAYQNRVGLKDGAGEYLAHLKKRNIPIAAATSSEEALFLPALKRNGIFRYFDAFVTVKEVSRGKGFPDIYEEAARRIGCKPGRCVVFEDIRQGIEGAASGGFATVAVHEERNPEDREMMKACADYYIYSYRPLLEGRPELFDQ